MPTGGVMSSRATPRMPANSGCEKGGGASPVRTGFDAQPRKEPSVSRLPARRRSRRVGGVMTTTLHPGHRFSSQFQRPVDVLVRVRGAERALLDREREMIDAALDELATVAPVELEIVARGEIVPVDRHVIAEVGAEGRADAAD